MLLPGLEEGLEPELYDEVIDILDPDLLDTIAGVDLDSVERNGITKQNHFITRCPTGPYGLIP